MYIIFKIGIILANKRVKYQRIFVPIKQDIIFGNFVLVE
ncbi:hypothetical protein Metbo_0855 [Methanobacterium lacus]|uniref:Uncharacterized protein n=1 Tax=Methanobacterium lacus (strain AL-21) TaxID=877455 RepID=F0TBM8_METLA|nr:hypothetical protein Metbo_0855 [Methanobacterium lacus]